MFRKISYYLILILFFSGCGESVKNKTEIKFWAMGVEGEKVATLIPLFEKENPDIRVNLQQVPWSAAHEKLITAYVSETLPDVFQLGNTWLPEFSLMNTIEDLSGFIKNSSVVKPEYYFPGIWETNVINNKVSGVSWYVDTRLMFYRVNILKAVGYSTPPKTWDELYDLSEKIVKYNHNSGYAIFLPTNEWVPSVLFGLQAGSNLLKDGDTYSDFSGKEFLQALTYLKRFYDNKLAPVDMTQVNNIYQAFEQHYFSIILTGPWNIKEMQLRLPRSIQNDWMTAPLPAQNDDFPGYSIAGGSSLVINKLSSNKAAAWKFIEFLSRDDIQYKFFELVSALPGRINVWENEAIKNNKYLEAFYIQLRKVKSTPKVPEWEQIAISRIQKYVELMAPGKISAEKAGNELKREVNLVLEKRRWMKQQHK
ncbi:MAG: extracellular solute-binding protein [Ignavibacteriaceae bacterium]